jgi:hypothetical protein
MQQELPAQAALRKTAIVDGAGMDRLHTALTLAGAAVLLAAIAFILGATVLT